MKPSTFVQYIIKEYSKMYEGWLSGAAWEGHAQVALNTIVRNHLISKVGIDNQGYLVQGEGRYRSAEEVQGFRPNIPGFREEAYSVKFPAKTGKGAGTKMVTNTADLRVINDRFVRNGTATNPSWLFKSTHYYIELKCESPVTKKFAGVDWESAWREDIDKLTAAKNAEAGQSITHPKEADAVYLNRRYWFVMICFSPEANSKLYSLEWTWKKRTSVGAGPQMGVFLDEIS